ncbi:MAG: hypothetical protein ETSY2_15795, partial [Candidatus Entotheonella gemina]
MKKLMTWMVFACVFIPYSMADADLQSGFTWLNSQAQSDGRLASGTDRVTPFQATSEALRTLQVLGDMTHPSVAPAQNFLASHTLHNTEYLSRKILAGIDSGEDVTAWLSELLTHQHPNSGFGTFENRDPSVLDTAFALEALAAQGAAHMSAAGYAVSFLLAQQRSDGSWADNDDAPSLYLTALALRALWLYRHIFAINEALDAAQDFLLAQREGQLWGETFATALALIAILPRLPDHALVAQSLAALQGAQLADGSWNHDVYTTALALRALHLAQVRVPNPDLATLIGWAMDGDTGLPMSGVRVQLTGPQRQSFTTGNDGRFAFSGLPSGAYQLSLDLVNYAPLSTTTTLPRGGLLNLGDLRLLKEVDATTTATVQGLVTEAATGQPLAGVTIRTGSQSATSTEDGRYQISNVVPGPLQLTASLDGYLSATGSAALRAGAILIFSPALTPGAV